MKKILYKIIKINNKRIEKQKDNDKFLRSLCTSNNTLDINKYIRLISMVKNKYKKLKKVLTFPLKSVIIYM